MSQQPNSSLAHVGRNMIMGGQGHNNYSSAAGLPQRPEPFWASNKVMQNRYYQDWAGDKRETSSERQA